VTLDSNAVRRLTAIQLRQGYVTLADIKSILPVDSMTPEEIGKAVAQLEEAGIDIEVARELLRRPLVSGVAAAPPTSHSRPSLPDTNGQMGKRTVQGSLLPRSTPSAQRRLSAVDSWWRPRAGQIARTLLLLAILCLLLIHVVVMR